MLKTYTLKNVNPSKLWKSIRFVLHWLSLPVKIFYNLSLGLVHNLMYIGSKKRDLKPVSFENRAKTFQEVLKKLPVIKGNGFKIYAPLIPLNSPINASNHGIENQAMLQGLLSFCSSELGYNDEQLINGLNLFLFGGMMSRGTKVNPVENRQMNNFKSCNTETLSAFSLAVAFLNAKKSKNTLEIDGNSYVPLSGPEYHLREKFETLVMTIMEEQDMALLEGANPEDPTASKLFKTLIKKAEGDVNLVLMKSIEGMFQPGLELTSKNALSILAALRVTDVKLRSLAARKYYRQLIWLYGYGLLGAIASPKENNLGQMLDLYTLSKLSKTWLGKKFWKFAMKRTWKLTKYQYNGLFTGLLEKAHPNTVNPKYIKTCLDNLYEETPRTYGFLKDSTVGSLASSFPVQSSKTFESEFMENLTHEVFLDVIEDRVRTGLSWVMQAIVLEKDPKILNQKEETP
jgi:hypothetical protein